MSGIARWGNHILLERSPAASRRKLVWMVWTCGAE